MSLEEGLIKYVIITPLTVVGFTSMYIFGGIILTIINTISSIFTGNFVDGLLEYFVHSALPPTSMEQVFTQVFLGTVVAGIKWYLAMSTLRKGGY